MKNKKAFLSVSFQQRDHLQAEFQEIIATLTKFDIEAIDFTTQFSFERGYEKEMMITSCEQIRASDLVIAEVSEKAIGVGIEIGYAVAMGKPVLYIRKSNAFYSTTVGGIVSDSFIYSDLEDLRKQLTSYLENLSNSLDAK